MGTILMLPNTFGRLQRLKKMNWCLKSLRQCQENVQKFYRLAKKKIANLRKCFQGAWIFWADWESLVKFSPTLPWNLPSFRVLSHIKEKRVVCWQVQG
jgi:hypothetical protein